MLKKLLATLDGLDAKYHALYLKQEDGTYKLDESMIPSNVEDVTGLKNNNLALKQEKIDLQDKLDIIAAKEKAAEEQGLSDDKKYDELLGRKTDEFNTKIKVEEDKTAKAVGSLKSSMIKSAVNSLAQRLAGDSATLLTPHLTHRFQVNDVEGEYTLQITDVNGVASNMTVDQLAEEFKSNKLYAPLLKGRDSSGGGSGGGSGAGGDAGGNYAKYFDPAGPDYNSEKQYELEQKDKVAHDKLVKKYGLDDPYRLS